MMTGDAYDKAWADLQHTFPSVTSREGVLQSLQVALFTQEFMRRNTTFSTIEEMFLASRLDISSLRDLENSNNPERWRYFVQRNTPFSTWEELRDAAIKSYFLRIGI